MRFSIAAAVPFLAGANAIIAGFSVPETVAAGSPFTLSIRTAGYIQSVYDVAFAVGFYHGAGYPDTLGNVLNSFYLGPQESNIETSINKTITIPAGTPQGEGIVTVSLFSLIGAVYSPFVNNFNVSITIGDETSQTYVASEF